jgi:3-oxoacyl-ACP reductase-like protein
MFEEIKARQGATTPGTLPNPGAAGTGILSRLGNSLGIAPPIATKFDKGTETCLTYMKDFKDKRVIMTGATGGIGAKVAKKLLKAGMRNIIIIRYSSYRC